jgi:hypothetical protein
MCVYVYVGHFYRKQCTTTTAAAAATTISSYKDYHQPTHPPTAHHLISPRCPKHHCHRCPAQTSSHTQTRLGFDPLTTLGSTNDCLQRGSTLSALHSLNTISFLLTRSLSLDTLQVVMMLKDSSTWTRWVTAPRSLYFFCCVVGSKLPCVFTEQQRHYSTLPHVGPTIKLMRLWRVSSTRPAFRHRWVNRCLHRLRRHRHHFIYHHQRHYHTAPTSPPHTQPPPQPHTLKYTSTRTLRHALDQVGTPDSSRIWDGPAYRNDGVVVENSKEMFRKLLCENVPDPDVLVNKVSES